MNERVSRRAFLGTAAAAGLATTYTGRAEAGTGAPPAHAPLPAKGLPRRGEFIIRDAYVMTMDPAVGDVVGGDVHVRNGRIVAVGKNLRGGGSRIDGRRTIVMPGLMDTHWHMWTTLYRSAAGSGSKIPNGYFAMNLRNGAAMHAEDAYHGVRLSLADAVNSGITFVHDWSHNIRGPAFADANLRAHSESGLRGRFSYGTPQGHPADQLMDLADLERVRKDWFSSGRVGGLMRLGVAGRPPGTSPAPVYRTEFAKARELGLPLSYHTNSNRAQGRAQMIQQLGNEGMLGPQTQLIHSLFTTAAEQKLIADTGTPVSTSPWSELLIGYGVTPIRDMARWGVPLTLSVDTTPLTGTAELFSVMRLALGLDRGEAEAEFDLSARRVLEMATVDAAKAMGVADLVGTVSPGKRADLIMIRIDDVNVAPFFDAPNTVALAAGPQNVDTVVVDGRILKRHGRLVAYDTAEVVRETQTALRGLLARLAATPRAARVASVSREDVACCG